MCSLVSLTVLKSDKFTPVPRPCPGIVDLILNPFFGGGEDYSAIGLPSFSNRLRSLLHPGQSSVKFTEIS